MGYNIHVLLFLDKNVNHNNQKLLTEYSAC